MIKTASGICSLCGQDCEAYEEKYKGISYWLSKCCDYKVDNLKIEEDYGDKE